MNLIEEKEGEGRKEEREKKEELINKFYMLDDEDKKWSVSKLYDQLIQEEKYLIQSDQFSSVYSSF